MRFILIITVFLLTALGCNTNETIGTSFNVATNYLEEKEFNVISHLKGETIILSDEMINQLPGKLSWSVQDFNVENYIGKEVDIEYFNINNHAFDSEQEETMVSVIVIDREAVGGNSYKPVEEGMRGANGIYSLDGKRQYQTNR